MKYVTFLVLLFATHAIAQKQKPQYYLYTKDWKAAKDVKTADYIIQSTNVSDSIFINIIFNGTGHLWRQESFRDAEQNIPHGAFA